MKFKKLISSALVFVMLFTTLIAAVPFTASAAEVKESGSNFDAVDNLFEGLSDEQVEKKVKEICDDYKKYGSNFVDRDGQSVARFSNAKELLDYELSKGYLVSVSYGDYAVYVNIVTGFMYYENKMTGHIMTSNPIDPAYQTKDNGQLVSVAVDLLSQVEVQYFEVENTSSKGTFNSFDWIVQNAMAPTVKSFTDKNGKQGISVEYLIGSAAAAFVAPGAMLYETALEKFVHPIFDSFEDKLQEYTGEEKMDANEASLLGLKFDSFNIKAHVEDATHVYSISKIKSTIDKMVLYAEDHPNVDAAEKEELNTRVTHMKNFFNQYTFIHPEIIGENTALSDAISAYGEGKAITVLLGAETEDIDLSTALLAGKAIKYLCGVLDSETAKSYEEACGYFPKTGLNNPCFYVTIQYTIDENGDLMATVPANLIDYPSEFVSLKNVSYLKHFGLGDMDKDGYVFFPDGSGAVVEFDDFYHGSTSSQTNISITLGDSISVYGSDYCYATVTGQHQEQVVMPVFGLVNDANATDVGYSKGQDVVDNGFFAIIEQGSSLANLTYISGGGTHKYISVYPTFAPFPTDTIDVSQTVSVSGLGSYTTAARARYEGDITMRYTLLVDDDVYAEAAVKEADFEGFVADYVGMALKYRYYLENLGVIDLLTEEEVYADLPLYIEALGSIDVTKKILSFPVTVSESLTSFDDIKTMYKELSDAEKTLLEKAAEYEAVADELSKREHPELYINEIQRNKDLAEKYTELSKNVTDIKNVNFKLTGFANGGMHSTYPAKLKWERSVGGSDGFKSLLDYAAGIRGEGASMEIFPDFDFMYINNTALFDGIGTRSTAASKVDNRYASKQEYDSVSRTFESLFALVVSTDSLDGLYNKFIGKYSQYNATGISVSTLGSDLNSNFEEKNPIVRETSMNDVIALLSKMSEKYNILSDTGNVYAVKYLDHILNAPIDSSHYNSTSYTVPFYGLVFHGCINYTGTPLNYSGSPEYEILRSIENGAALYYVLCMHNTNYLKEDPQLSDYYGIDYNNWFEKVVSQYHILNNAIGDLQLHRIVDHSKITAERIIDEDEMAENYERLIEEFLSVVDEAISNNIDKKLKEMREEGLVNAGLKFVVSEDEVAAIVEVASMRVNVSAEDLEAEYAFVDRLNAVFDKYKSVYDEGSETVTVVADNVDDYKSKYSYVTDSVATDENYVKTDFTCDNGNVVMVTYEREVDGKTDTVVFLLNYNYFDVKIKIDETVSEYFANVCDEDGYVVLEDYSYIKIQDKED